MIDEVVGGRQGQIIEGPLIVRQDDIIPANKIAVADFGTLGRNVLRLRVEPSFSGREHMVEFVGQPNGCNSVFDDEGSFIGDTAVNPCWNYAVTVHSVVDDQDLREMGAEDQQVRFSIRAQEYFELILPWWRARGTWRGSRGVVVDGTSALLEISRDGDLLYQDFNLASAGFEPRTNPGVLLAEQIRLLVLAMAPSGSVPTGQDWNVGMNDPDCEVVRRHFNVGRTMDQARAEEWVWPLSNCTVLQ